MLFFWGQKEQRQVACVKEPLSSSVLHKNGSSLQFVCCIRCKTLWWMLKTFHWEFVWWCLMEVCHAQWHQWLPWCKDTPFWRSLWESLGMLEMVKSWIHFSRLQWGSLFIETMWFTMQQNREIPPRCSFGSSSKSEITLSFRVLAIKVHMNSSIHWSLSMLSFEL